MSREGIYETLCCRTRRFGGSLERGDKSKFDDQAIGDLSRINLLAGEGLPAG